MPGCDRTDVATARTMARILSRLLVRVAIVAASLAWAGFVFTQTVGDPGRGERIAAAVLADGDARAEVAAPITSAVMRTTGLPAEQRPSVAANVDRLLQDPVGARTFVDPFAGSWARMLGEDDPRPSEVDLVPLLEQSAATLPPGAVDAVGLVERLPVTGVPLPRVRLDWMGGVRDAIAVSLLPLALVAVGAFAAAFAIGDRRRVLRRFGVWAVVAGLTWVAIPPLVVWAAGRWASGADAVIAVSLDEATAGLLPAAVALAVAGTLAFATSFAASSARAPAGARASRSASTSERRSRTSSGTESDRRTPVPGTPASRTVPSTGSVVHTAEIPATHVMPAGDRPSDDRTVEMPAVARTPSESAVDAPADADRDALWDYYGST